MNNCKKCNIHRDNLHDKRYLDFKLSCEHNKLIDFVTDNPDTEKLNAVQVKYFNELKNRVDVLRQVLSCNHLFK